VTDAGVLTRMLHAIDRLDWTTVRDSFTDTVYTDYTSLWGGAPGTAAIDELVGQWQEFVQGFGATQHLTGPLSVSGDRVDTHVTAHHWRSGTGNAWVVHGHYIARIAGRKISELTLQTFHASGDPDLPDIPALRASG
jgi:SnoaL-like domain